MASPRPTCPVLFSLAQKSSVRAILAPPRVFGHVWRWFWLSRAREVTEDSKAAGHTVGAQDSPAAVITPRLGPSAVWRLRQGLLTPFPVQSPITSQPSPFSSLPPQLHSKPSLRNPPETNRIVCCGSQPLFPVAAVSFFLILT